MSAPEAIVRALTTGAMREHGARRVRAPVTFGTVAALLTAVALVASYLPAYRASRIDPLEALRFE